jgi:pyruvate/2-oxoglutarate dehydrogenase complex dihydrolipoamide acyltransferase (E2) component
MAENAESFTVKPFPRIRKATIGVLRAARKKNMIHTLVEMDISKARQTIRQLRRETKNFYSLTGYIIFCVARAVEQNKHIHACRNRKNQMVLFDNVDVSTTIERTINGNKEVVAKIIRAANRKTVAEISEELMEEKSGDVQSAEVFRSVRLFLAIPGFIRQFIFRLLDKSPRLMKKRAGTVMVTSANMAGKGAGWGIPVATHTLNVTIGGIVDRLVLAEGEPENREYICITFSFDHDIVDGAPAARFIRHLKRQIESAEM